MTPYFLLLSLPAWLALTQRRNSTTGDTSDNFQWKTLALIFTLAIGLRDEVGGDWFTYVEGREYVTSLGLAEALTELRNSDPAFALLTWLSPGIGDDYFVNLVCGALFTLGLVLFSRRQPEPWLALTVAVPYLVTVVAMGYTRQGVAIGLSLCGLAALDQKKTMWFLFWVGLATTFHKSAVILIPLAVFSGSQHRFSTVLGVMIIGPLVFTLFLAESVSRLVGGYVLDGMESSGAFIRVMMNALPAFLFLVFRRRFDISETSRSFWTWMSIGALLFIPALALSPSSTAVDRVALYWIPIQIFFWSRLPKSMNKGPRSELLLRHAVVVYSFSVLIVWLNFADHAFAWIPYKFYPWEVIKAGLNG